MLYLVIVLFPKVSEYGQTLTCTHTHGQSLTQLVPDHGAFGRIEFVDPTQLSASHV